jgi:aminoglycoside phosphotransferase (APT) family kinase protein
LECGGQAAPPACHELAEFSLPTEALRTQAAPLSAPPEITTKAAEEFLSSLDMRTAVTAVLPCAGGVSNHNYRIEFEDGSLALLRVYRWGHDEPEPQRRLKEPMLHRLLADAGVPVPRVIAASDRCALMEWIDGVKLRQIALSEPPVRLEQAWSEAGAALRMAHAVNPFGRTAGEIVGEQLQPFAMSWAEWNAREIRKHAGRLRALDAITDVELSRIEQICTRLPELLGAPPPMLVHNDAHPANVLVAQRNDAWHLAAWIDWEYAWLADPDWDLARFAFFGTAQVGAIPETFWTGYGGRPSPIRNAIYELHMVAWLAGLRPTSRAPTAPELLARDRLRKIGQLLEQIEAT